MRDFIDPALARDHEAVRQLVGTVIASGLATFDKGRLTATPRLTSFSTQAEAMRASFRASWRGASSNLVLPDGSRPAFVEDVEAYPFIGLALRDEPLTVSRWEVSTPTLRAHRLLGHASTAGIAIGAPIALGALALVLL